MGVSVRELVVNRTTPPESACPQCTPRVAEERRALATLRESFPRMRIASVRAASQEPRGVDALLDVARGYEPLRRAAHPRPGRVTGRDLLVTRGKGDKAVFDHVVPRGAKLILFGGKGGVGKTTCAAATAIEAAARRAKTRARVLLLSTDPAHSLGDALGAAIGDEARRVKGAPKNLVVRELDADAAFALERDRYRDAVDALFDRILRGSRFDVAFDRAVVQDLIELAPPGLDELFGVIALVDALAPGEGAFDLVIVDTAPTGHTMRLLAMPESALQWVHALMEIVLKYRQVVGLGELAADLVELAKKLRALERLLADAAHARFVVVTRAAELPRRETARLVRDLRKMKIAVATVIVNAVTAGTCARCRHAEALEAREIAKLAQLGHAIIRAPATFPPPHGPRALHAFARRWQIRR
jgi:arsenite-transporting ATPase